MDPAQTTRRLICQSCGTPFDCCAESPGGCWCVAVSLHEAVLQQLKATYADCICRTCLLRTAASAADGTGQRTGDSLPANNNTDAAQKHPTKT